MRHGHWIPLSKAFVRYLPKDRPYTEIEAGISLQLDYDEGNEVTITGYCDLWRWSKNRVYKFLDRLGVKIIYPDDTQKRQNQRGLISILKRDRKETDWRLLRFIDSKDLREGRDRKESERGLKRDRKRIATRDPNPNPEHKNIICPFEEIVNLYHSILPELPTVKILKDGSIQSQKLIAAINARWKSNREYQFLDWWNSFFTGIKDMPFLLGANDRNWTANLLWMVGPENFDKILNGNYYNKGNGDGYRTGKKTGFGNSRTAGERSTKYSGIGTVLSSEG